MIEACPPRILVSEKAADITRWSDHCLEMRLYREDGVARDCFLKKHRIHKMALIPWIAWAMVHDYGPGPISFHTRASYFTHVAFRRQGISHGLWRILFPGSYEYWKESHPEKARLVESGSWWALVREWERVHA